MYIELRRKLNDVFQSAPKSEPGPSQLIINSYLSKHGFVGKVEVPEEMQPYIKQQATLHKEKGHVEYS